MDVLVTIFGWGSPIGLGVFLVSVAAMLFLLASTIGKLAKIDRELNSKR